MNPRTLFSGPSRLRPLLPQLAQSRRYLLTFPHPDLDPSNGSTKLVIRTFDNIPSLVHAYAIVRAVESKLGASILDLHIPKDLDSRKLGPVIFLTTLRPVKIENPLLLEIPSPALSSESNFLGGPSLADIQAALSSSPGTSTNLTTSPTGKDTPLQFRVETQRKLTMAQRKAGGRARRQRYKQDGREGSEIVAELQKFGSGFYGGFEGLADKFKALSDKSFTPGGVPGQANVRTATATGAAAEQSEEAAVDVEQVKAAFEPVQSTSSPSSPLAEEVESALSTSAPEPSSTAQPEPDVVTEPLSGAEVTRAAGPISGNRSSKARQAREQRLRESAIASAQRDLELKERKKREAEAEAEGNAAAAEEQRKQQEEADREAQRAEEGSSEKKDAGFFGGVFGKRD